MPLSSLLTQAAQVSNREAVIIGLDLHQAGNDSDLLSRFSTERPCARRKY
jgi:hypothetical protein